MGNMLFTDMHLDINVVMAQIWPAFQLLDFWTVKGPEDLNMKC